MRTIWEGEMAEVAICRAPASLLEHVRSRPGAWWQIIASGQSWFICYRSGRWVFSTPKHERAVCDWAESHRLLETLGAKWLELRLDTPPAATWHWWGLGLVILFVLSAALILLWWLLEGLGVTP